MNEPSCWALCDKGHLVPIWTCSGICTKCEGVVVWPRPGLTISMEDCDCGYPAMHNGEGHSPVPAHLCPGTLNLIKQKLAETKTVAVGKPFSEPVPIKPFLPKTASGMMMLPMKHALMQEKYPLVVNGSLEDAPFTKSWGSHMLDKFLEHRKKDPPKQKIFDLEETRTEITLGQIPFGTCTVYESGPNSGPFAVYPFGTP